MPEQEKITIEPRPGVTPPAETPAPEESGGAELPDELLQIPAVMGLVSGTPGAFSATLAEFEKLPEAKIIAANKDALMSAGVGFYRSLLGDQGVIFNGLFISAEEIQSADQSGALLEVAPPFAQLNAAIGSSGRGNPVLQEGARPTGFKQGAGAAPAPMPQTASPRPQSAAAQKSLSNARSKNLQPGSPTSGAAPGGGALLRSILKPVV